MSETRYPAWWAKLQEDMVKAGCFEEGALERFSVVMTPEDHVEWIEGIQLFVVLDGVDGAGALADRRRPGTYRIGGIPVVVSPDAVPGHPAVVPL
jgi:hypothetical protein